MQCLRRHIIGSLLAACGVHPQIALELMRHSNINLTMNIYTHVQESETQAAIDKLLGLEEQFTRRGRHAS